MGSITKALKFSQEAHKGQMRANGLEPYVNHPFRVAMALSMLPGVEDDHVRAALLHDVVEDTHVTAADIKQEFGMAVASMVMQLTNASKLDDFKGNRKERKAYDLKHLAQTDPWVKRIKMLDRIDNLSTVVDDKPDFARRYATESVALLEAIGDADSVLAEELQRHIDRILEIS